MGLTASSISSNSARISWATASGALSYSLQYRQLGTTRWRIKSTTGTVAKLKNLRPNTSYEYEVATVCADGASEYSPIQIFTTTP
jgi:hypothetical protein